ncbi:MAG: Uma2 family endonuclease [Gemmatales bacterium]|nr:Uma2 family endonuclease [Gemmatales bacterium]
MSAVVATVETEAKARPTITPDDLLRMARDRRYELVDGQLVEKSMAATASTVTAEIVTLLNQYCQNTQAGIVLVADQGYQCFPHRPNTVRFPDVSFIARARLTPDLAQGHIRIAPDLVVEVLSPGDLAQNVDQRIDDFLKAGVRLLWVVHPEARWVEVHRLGQRGEILRESDTLDGGDVIPGFRVPVRDLFRPLQLFPPTPTTTTGEGAGG